MPKSASTKTSLETRMFGLIASILGSLIPAAAKTRVIGFDVIDAGKAPERFAAISVTDNGERPPRTGIRELDCSIRLRNMTSTAIGRLNKVFAATPPLAAELRRLDGKHGLTIANGLDAVELSQPLSRSAAPDGQTDQTLRFTAAAFGADLSFATS